MVSIDLIKQLREETEVSLAECKKALEESGGDLEKAKAVLRERGKEISEKKQEREAQQGVIEAYTHGNGKIGVLLELRCETDFVAKSPDFKNLAHELALQVTATDPQDASELLEQDHVRDPQKKVKDLIAETVAKLGEKIVVERFVRFQL